MIEEGHVEVEQGRRWGERRGVWAFACVASGILLGDLAATVPATLWLAGACVLLIAVIVAKRVRRGITLGMLGGVAVLIGAGVMSARVLTVPADRLMLGESELLMVRGKVHSATAQLETSDAWSKPFYWQGPSVMMQIDLHSAQIAGQWQNVSGRLSIYGPSGGSGGFDAAVGTEVEAAGSFRPVSGPVNPGQSDGRRWAALEGRVGSMRVEAGDAVRIIDDGPAGGAISVLRRWHAGLRSWASLALEKAIGGTAKQDDPARALLRAMIIGGEGPSLRPVSDDMARLGIVHIISISGFHLALVAWVVLLLIRVSGDRGVWEYGLAFAAVGAYLLVVPAEAPVLRSGLMVLALLASEASGRRYDRLNTLGWTAFALALWRPLDIYSPGFQLSMGVTAVLIWRSAAWREAMLMSGRFGLPGVKGRVRREATTPILWLRLRVADLLCATGLAWVVSAPLVAWHAGTLSLLGVVAGIVLTIPSMLAIGAGFVAMLIAAVCPPAGELVGQIAVMASSLTVQGAELAARMPGSAVSLPSIPLGWVLASTVVGVAVVSPGGWKRMSVRLAALVCVVWLCGVLLLAARPVSEATLDRFALPRSSATLVRAADQAVLIDPGSGSERSGHFLLRRAVAACGGWRVRTVLITGPQAERFNHLPELSRALGVQDVLVPPVLMQLAERSPASDAARLIARLEGRGVRVRSISEGEALRIGEVVVSPQGQGVIRLDVDGLPSRVVELDPIEAHIRTVLEVRP